MGFSSSSITLIAVDSRETGEDNRLEVVGLGAPIFPLSSAAANSYLRCTSAIRVSLFPACLSSIRNSPVAAKYIAEPTNIPIDMMDCIGCICSP